MKAPRIYLCTAKEQAAIEAGTREGKPDDDYVDLPWKPFHELTVAEHIKIYETPDPTFPDTPRGELERLKHTCEKIGVPSRVTMVMRKHELEAMIDMHNAWNRDNDLAVGSLAKVHQAMEDFAEANGKDWVISDAKEAMQRFSIFRDSITVQGRTFKAPELIDRDTTTGQWLELIGIFESFGTSPESELYARCCGTLMMEEGERWPIQGKDEDTDTFNTRFEEWRVPRDGMFTKAPWVEVMGCAAFFFCNSERFRLVTATSLPRFRTIAGYSTGQGPVSIPSTSELHDALLPPSRS